MRQKKLNKVLRERARELGLCDEWYNEWGKKESNQELVWKYLKGIDFCIKHDYPSLEFIRENFSKEEVSDYGVYIDYDVKKKNVPISAFIGSSKGEMNYDGLTSCSVYIRHQSDVVINASDGAIVYAELYDNAKIHVLTDRYSKVYIYQHGGNVEFEGNVIIRNRVDK